MVNEKENIRISKFMSLVLRHKPETIGLQLDRNGWISTKELMEKMNEHGFHITPSVLANVVATNSKSRFTFNDDETMIRANQGHSIDVDLDLTETAPPAYLYHGTGEKWVPSIIESGLDKQQRRHVHLSSDLETAINVGGRHGKPKVFVVLAAKMKEHGYHFYLSANNVWLTDHVPAEYLKLLDTKK